MSTDAGVEPIEPTSFDFGDLDFGDSTGPSGTEQQTFPTAGAENQQVTENPAWVTLKEKLPKEFHSQIDPILKDWDAGVKRQFEANKSRYSAFDPLIEQGITPDAIQQAMGIVERINSEPLAFYEQMRDLLLQNGMIEEAEQVQDKIEDLEEEQGQQSTDPRVDQILQAQQQLANSIQAQQAERAQQEAAARADRQIKAELQAIESRVGTLPEWAKVELFNRAAFLSEQQDRDVSLIEAYRDMQALRQQMINQPRPGAQAPRVVPSGGGFPAPARDKDALKTSDGRIAAGMDIARRLREQQQ